MKLCFAGFDVVTPLAAHVLAPIPSCDTQDHLLAFADSLEDLCSMSSVSFFRGVLPTVLALAEAEDSQVATKFRSLAVRMVEGVLNEEALREHVVPFATARVGLGKKPVSRILAASLFGALAKRFPSPVVQRDFLKQALSLCQVSFPWPLSLRFLGPPSRIPSSALCDFFV